MPVRISNRAVDALTCPTGKDRIFQWDDALAGFGVAAFPSGQKVYVAQFRLNGRSRRMKIGTHGTLTPSEARSRAKKILAAVEEGRDPIDERRSARNDVLFRDAAAEYLELHVKRKRKSRTYDEYGRLLKLHINPALGSRRLSELKRTDLVRFHADMSSTPGAANRALSLFSSVWHWAARRSDGGPSPNPAASIERYPEAPRERYLSSDELARLGDALRRAETEGLAWAQKPTGKRVRKNHRTVFDVFSIAAIRLLVLTGARLREILSAKWSYVDWERGLLLLPDSKTGKKTIYLSAPALELLEALPRVKDNPFIVAGSKAESRSGGDRNDGSRIRTKIVAPRSDLKRPWAAVARAAGLSGVRIHDLRHSFAATGAGASLGLPMIGKLLGHTQPATTARYAHLDADPMRHAVNLIGGQIAAAMKSAPGEVIPLRRQR